MGANCRTPEFTFLVKVAEDAAAAAGLQAAEQWQEGRLLLPCLLPARPPARPPCRGSPSSKEGAVFPSLGRFGESLCFTDLFLNLFRTQGSWLGLPGSAAPRSLGGHTRLLGVAAPSLPSAVFLPEPAPGHRSEPPVHAPDTACPVGGMWPRGLSCTVDPGAPGQFPVGEGAVGSSRPSLALELPGRGHLPPGVHVKAWLCLSAPGPAGSIWLPWGWLPGCGPLLFVKQEWACRDSAVCFYPRFPKMPKVPVAGGLQSQGRWVSGERRRQTPETQAGCARSVGLRLELQEGPRER